MVSRPNARLLKELAMLARDPGPGISVWAEDEGNIHLLTGQIIGPEESPYEGGVFSVSISIPQRYPFEPPSVRFTTRVYHPNIDSEGRICLDTLKTQPQGSWSPSININTLLLTIRVLLRHPNADDGLVPSITEQYRRNIDEFNRIAREHTLQYAVEKVEPRIMKESPAIASSSAAVKEFCSSSHDASSSEYETDSGEDGEAESFLAVSIVGTKHDLRSNEERIRPNNESDALQRDKKRLKADR